MTAGEKTIFVVVMVLTHLAAIYYSSIALDLAKKDDTILASICDEKVASATNEVMTSVKAIIAEDQLTTSNSFHSVLVQLAEIINKNNDRIRSIEYNDALDRAVRESLVFTVVSGKVVDVEFDGGKFARDYFQSLETVPNFSKLRIGMMFPKTEFKVRNGEER